MNTKTIPRIDTATIAEQMKQGRADLLADAAKHLGYQGPNPTNLLQRLMDLDIAPFRTVAVEEYKRGKESVSMWSGTRHWLIWFFASLAVLGLGILIDAKSSLGALALTLCIVGVTSLVISLVGGTDDIGTGDRKVKRWERVDIAKYDVAIPDHVLDKAVQIKRALPECSIQIDYLDTNYEHRDPDPFLHVSLKDAGYYIEQWDERDFPKLDE